MGPNIKIEGSRDGQAVPLPQDLDALAITTEQGAIHIDLAEQVQNMVLMRASVARRTPSVVRLILSPMTQDGWLSASSATPADCLLLLI